MLTTKSLLDIFASRPRRFALLDKGLCTVAPQQNGNWLEIGCNQGDATAHLARVWGVKAYGLDCSAEAIALASEQYSCESISFYCGRAQALPFSNGVFDGIVSEAAYSPLHNKEQAIQEYFRVLKPGGKLIINDFALKNPTSEMERHEYAHIPCFAGVETLEVYQSQLQSGGFRIISCEEQFGELIAIVTWLSKSANIPVKEVGGVLSHYYRTGIGQSCCTTVHSGMMKRARLTYGQIILERTLGT